MLEEGEIEELMSLLEQRKRAVERLDGMSHSVTANTKMQTTLQDKVKRLEELLREYGLQIETEFE